MFELDRSIPFVNQVFSFIEGKTSAEACIQTLRVSEQKWDVEHIVPPIEVYVEDYEIKTRSPRRFSHIIGLKDESLLWEKHILDQYYGFLSETHLVFDTMAYAETFDIILSNKYSFQATARAWGEMYAKWANRVSWLGRKDWSYLDFYMYLADQIEEFSEWAEAAHKIILLKTEGVG